MTFDIIIIKLYATRLINFPDIYKRRRKKKFNGKTLILLTQFLGGLDLETCILFKDAC